MNNSIQTVGGSSDFSVQHEFTDQAAVLGRIPLPEEWISKEDAPTPRMLWMLPDGVYPVVRFPEFHPPDISSLYSLIFRNMGVTDESVELCIKQAKRKVSADIDHMWSLKNIQEIPLCNFIDQSNRPEIDDILRHRMSLQNYAAAYVETDIPLSRFIDKIELLK